MPSQNWSYNKRRMLWPLLIVSLTGCSPISGNQYFCPPEIDYDNTGKVRPEKYAVDRTCFKSQTKKLAACYEEAK